MDKYNESKINYSKLTGGLFNYFSLSKNKLKSFFDTQKEKNAFSKFNLGLQEIDITKIIGSVQKNNDFNSDYIPINNSVETRWCSIYMAYLEDKNLPPIELYKIKDEYFVYDGNHRVSVTKYLNFKTIEAIVTEFLPNTSEKTDIIYNEQFFFQKKTNLSNINFSDIGEFETLIPEIEDFKFLIKSQEIDFFEISKLWKKMLFNPIIKIFSVSGLFKNLENGNIYLKVTNKLKTNPHSGYVETILTILDYPNIFFSDNISRQFKKLELLDSYLNHNIFFTDKILLLNDLAGIDFKTPLKLIREIDNIPLLVFEKNKIENFSINLRTWYYNIFIFRYSIIEQKLLSLPDKYKNSWLKIDNPEKLNIELIEYTKIFSQDSPVSLSIREVVLTYIIDIYIPIIEIINKQNKKEKIAQLYYSISSKFRELHNYKKNVTVSEAANIILSYKNLLKSIHLQKNIP